MQALDAYNACMDSDLALAPQYTLRNIPAHIDKTLRKRMKEEGKSLNTIALEALAAGAQESLRPARDLSYLIGSMSTKEAKALSTEIEMQKLIDPSLWR